MGDPQAKTVVRVYEEPRCPVVAEFEATGAKAIRAGAPAITIDAKMVSEKIYGPRLGAGAFRVPVPCGVRMRDAACMEERPCRPCGGLRVTEHTEHAVETDESGNQRSVIRQWTGPCGGSGVTYQ